MRGENYFAIAIEGNPEQFSKILSKYDYSPDNGLGSLNGDGVWRIRNKVLCIEIEGWGAEIDYAERTLKFAKSLGCVTHFLDLPAEAEENHIVTDDTEGKYFVSKKYENGVVMWDWAPAYRPDDSKKENAEKRDAVRKQFIELLKPLRGKAVAITDSFVSDRDDAKRPGFEWPDNYREDGCDYQRQFFSSVWYQGMHSSEVPVRWHEVAFGLLTPDTMNMERYLTLDAHGSCHVIFHDLEDGSYSRQPIFFEIPSEEFEKALCEVRELIAKRPKTEPKLFRLDGEVIRKILSCTVYVKAVDADEAYGLAFDAIRDGYIDGDDGFIVRDEGDEDEDYKVGDAVEVSLDEFETARTQA